MKQIISTMDKYCVAHWGKETEKEKFFYCTVPYEKLNDFVSDMRDLQSTFETLKVIQNIKEHRYELYWNEGKVKVKAFVSVSN